MDSLYHSICINFFCCLSNYCFIFFSRRKHTFVLGYLFHNFLRTLGGYYINVSFFFNFFCFLLVKNLLCMRSSAFFHWNQCLYRDLFFAINAFRWLVPASLFFVIAFFLSNADNKYTVVNIIFLISTVIYVIYQIYSGDPRLNEELLVQNVLMQKSIAIIHIISIFSLTFCFNSQIKNKNL